MLQKSKWHLGMLVFIDCLCNQHSDEDKKITISLEVPFLPLLVINSLLIHALCGLLRLHACQGYFFPAFESYRTLHVSWHGDAHL